MADTKISALTDGVTANATDAIPVARAGANRYITPGYLYTYLTGAGVLVSGGALGTPSSGVATNLTGTASGLTAGNVTTNANLTGHVTSVGNAAVLGSFTMAQLNAALSDGDVLGYNLQFIASQGNPADGATYFIGLIGALTAVTASGVLRIPIPKAGTVKRVDVHIGVAGVLGSGEAITLNFRLNNTTDTLISNAAVASAAAQEYTVATTIAVAQGDYFEIKWLSPTWVTNPTIVIVNGNVYIE